MSQHLSISRADGILEIRFDRPDRKNAFTAAMYDAMSDAIEAAESEAAVEVILFLGSEDVFTAGNDLGDFQANPPGDLDSPPFRFMRAVLRSSKVLVAGVNGLAVGVGTTLLLHCDLVVAAKGARFIVPFVNLGLVPEFASSRLLPQMLGQQRAARHLMLGDPLEAEDAYRAGLVSELTDDGQASDLARAYARRLLEKPPQALARTKALIAPEREALVALIEKEAAVFAQCLTGPEFAEAATAFFEKRPPRFARG